MQVKGHGAEAFLKAPPATAEVALLYGPDAGMVRERSKRLEAVVLGETPDPFRRAEVSEAALKDDPGAFYSEAAAISMLGGRKFVRIRANTETAAAALEAYIGARQAGSPRPDAFAVIEAGDLRPTNKLRKLAEACSFVAAIGCWPDDEESLEALIAEAFKTAGARLSPEARGLLLERLGADRALSRQEIDKLLLYAGAGRGRTVEIGAADVLAITGDAGSREIADLIEAVMVGDVAATMRLTQRLRAAPVSQLRALSTQLDRLAGARVNPGFGQGRKDTLTRHLSRWPPRRIARARKLLLEAEIACKSTGFPAEEIAERALLMLAHGARGSG